MNDSGSHEVKPLDAMYGTKLLMIWIYLLHVLRVVDDMNESGSWVQSHGWYERLRIPWAQASRCYEQLRIKDNMNDSWSWANGLKWYKELKVVHHMKDFELWSQGSLCYEKLRIMVDKNEFTSRAYGFRCYKQLLVINDMRYFGS